MRKIIFINRFFYPDHSATSQILSDLMFNITVDNVELHVITSRLLYEGGERLAGNEIIYGVNVHRVWTTNNGRSGLIGRAIDYLTFYLMSFVMMLQLVSKGDILVAKTDPPMISVLAAVVVKFKKGILVNWLQDLFPEVALKLKVKGLSEGNIYGFLKYIRNWSLIFAKKNVVIGDVMANKLKDEIPQLNTIEIIHNWVVGQKIQSVNQKNNSLRNKWGLENKFVVGYSGNLGRAHDYKTIYECIKSVSKNKHIMFVFIGGGVGMEKLKERVFKSGIDNIIFKPYQPIENLSESLSVSDVHIVTLEKELEGLIVPSKIYGILAVGRPIIFIGSEKGEFSKMLEKNQCGYIVAPKKSEDLINVVLGLQSDIETYNQISKNTESLYCDNFKYGKSIMKWKSLFQSLTNP